MTADTSLIFNIIGKDKASKTLEGVNRKVNAFATAVLAGGAVMAAASIKMAADFQTQMNRIVTGAGESQANLAAVSAGVLKMAGDVGQSTSALTSALYTIESAGFHGANGLKVLQAAAEGAKVGNAELATVGDAVTTALNAYHMSASQAVDVTNALIAAEGQGKTNMEALAGSLATVLPTASAANVGLNEVLAAMSTMTAEGTPAAVAATYLRQTIGMLSNPSAKAADEMKSLGLNAVTVGMNLGKNGLANTLTMLTDAIEKHMGPAGTVLIDKLRSASTSTSAFQKVLADLNPTQQTYVGALATMVGGTKSMQAALELTGANMKTFQANTDIIAGHVKNAGGQVEGWALVQQSFNQKLAEVKGKIEAFAITLGTKLLPYAIKFVDNLQAMFEWGVKNKSWLGPLVGTLVAAAGAIKAVVIVSKAWEVVQAILNAEMDANPVGIVIVAIAALVAGIIYAWTHFSWFRTAVRDTWKAIKVAWSAIAAASVWLWRNVLVPAFKGIKAAVEWVAKAAMWLWNDAIKPAWNAIRTASLWLWNNVLKPVFGAIAAVMAVVFRIVKSFAALWLWLWIQILKPVFFLIALAWKALSTEVMWAWHHVLQPVFHAIGWAAKGVGSVAMWLWHHAIEPAFKGIGAVIGWVWHHLIKPIWDTIVSTAHTMHDVLMPIFDGIGSGIRAAFDGTVSFIKGVINDVIDVVNGAIHFLNSDVIDALNNVPGVDFPNIPSIPHLASGGVISRGGMALVGERGPEQVFLPTGAQVVPNGGSAGGAVTLRAAPGDQVAEVLLSLLRPVVRGRYGGNVTAAVAGRR